jgi:tripartite-type tricarboxylate transporter receptor subunit TctC
MPAMLAAIVAAAVLTICSVAPAQAQPDFKGKTITLYVAFTSGGGYDQYARFFARHFGRHVRGEPRVIVSNMPGANGFVAANYLYGVAPRDGTALGLLYQTIAQDQVLGGQGIQFDAPKFRWIGRIASNIEIMYTWHTVPIRSVADLADRETILAIGSLGGAIHAHLLADAVGARFKLVRGYPGTQEIHLALERGEAEGAYSSLNTIRTMWGHWLRDKKINIILQTALERHPALPDVPTMIELGKTAEDKASIAFFAGSGAIGRSIVAPPELPEEERGVLRAAFQATMKDEQFLAEARQLNMDIDPLAGEELGKISEHIVNVGPLERARARSMPTR